MPSRYTLPSVSEHELKNLFSATKQAGSGRCLVVGDFNYLSINWENWECNKEDEEFVDLIKDNFLFQHVRVPTRKTYWI